MDEYKHSSKASGATPVGALTCPHGETSHIFEDCNPLHIPIPSIMLPVKKKGGLYCSRQIKITKGYRREAIERYKHIATYMAISPILGRGE